MYLLNCSFGFGATFAAPGFAFVMDNATYVPDFYLLVNNDHIMILDLRSAMRVAGECHFGSVGGTLLAGQADSQPPSVLGCARQTGVSGGKTQRQYQVTSYKHQIG